jgi:predicted nuclease with TOPRIM domain
MEATNKGKRQIRKRNEAKGKIRQRNKAKRKIRRRKTKQKKKYESETKRKEKYRREKKRSETKRKEKFGKRREANKFMRNFRLKVQLREFLQLWFFSSKVYILGPDSYTKLFPNLVSNSQSYSNLKLDSPLHDAAGSQKKIVSWGSFNI